MSLNIQKTAFSPNCEQKSIKVEFLVLHYTSTSLSHTLDLFSAPQSRVSSHLVISSTGRVYEVVGCMKGMCFKAWHAGESHWTTKEKQWKNFNNFSVGVELVNKNGNLFAYRWEQYKSLKALLTTLKEHYPALRDPDRVVGHEHIAGHRGKVDPGHCFDWPLFFKMNYKGPVPLREPVLTQELRKHFFDQARKKTQPQKKEYWMNLNRQMEHMAMQGPAGQFKAGLGKNLGDFKKRRQKY